MTYKTLFGGYTPELDLSASDWTKRWSSVATATVLGVSYEFIDSQISQNDAQDYTFSSVIPEAGTYIIAVVTQGENPGGIQGVSIDGQLGRDLREIISGTLTISFWLADPTSFSDGDINVRCNSSLGRCAVGVYRLCGDITNYSDDAIGFFVGTPDTIDMVVRQVLIGAAIKVGDAASTEFYWGGPIRKRHNDFVEGTSYWSLADRLLITDETSQDFNLNMNAPPTGAFGWILLSFRTPVTYFPSGQGVRFQKQTSDARSFWSWDTAGRLEDVEILSLVRSPSSSGTFFSSGVMARAGGALGTEDGYGFLLAQPSANARSLITIQRLVAGTSLTISQATFNWSLNTNYWMRFKLRGSAIQGKIWAEGTAEPDAWTLEVTDTSHTLGYVGVFHFEVLSQLEVGYFEAKRLYTEWPYDAVPFNWTLETSGGPQSNKISFKPDVGPNIERRRASAVARRYQVECPGLTQAEYISFLEFYHTTLKEGTLVFMARDPFTGDDKLWKFGDDDPAYSESFQRPVGEDFDNGLYKLSFSVVRLD